MRNAVAFEISRMTGLSYTPSGEFVEVVMNGRHIGNYYLTEQIKVDKNRVDIAELDENATDPKDINGGYIFELDSYFDEEFKFRSEIFNLPWMFKDPDVVNVSQFNYMAEYVNNMEREIKKIPQANNYQDYLDIESCVDWFFVNELMMNYEPNHPKSTYFYKDKNDKLKMGPVWDYDWGTLLTTSMNYFIIENAVYYSQLFKDQAFIRMIKERWDMFYPKFETIPDFIDRNADLLEKSDLLNFELWGYAAYPNYEPEDYRQAVKKIKDAYISRLSWLDNRIRKL